MTSREPPLAGQVLEETGELSLAELCDCCAVEERRVIELVEAGVIETRSTQWRFDGRALRRARISLRLQRDLGVNPEGTAVVLDLLERIEALERRLGSSG